MYPHAIARHWRTPRLGVATFSAALSACLLTVAAATLGAQSRPDSAKVAAPVAATTDSVRNIEGVLVRAIRANEQAPISQTTIGRAAITQRHFGQDVPMLLMNAAPSMTSHTETGTNWGYSYLRLRGIGRSLNICIHLPAKSPIDRFEGGECWSPCEFATRFI